MLDLSTLYQVSNAKSRSICPENFTGEPGKGGDVSAGGRLCARAPPAISERAGRPIPIS